jgi:DNA-directed RNA polymerase subunit L
MIPINSEMLTFNELIKQSMETLKQASNRILDQLIKLGGSMTDEQFTKKLPVLFQNSIGMHYRHIIEFYGIMLEGFRSGMVNYDSRGHDPELENNREICLQILQQMKNRFLEPIWPDPIELAGSYSVESDETFTVTTNAEREIVYNIEHAIHHMAIIRIAIQHEYPDLILQEEFGYALSTLKHLREK